MRSHQLFKSGLHFPNKPEAPRSTLFVFHRDIHGAVLVFWYAGFQARSVTNTAAEATGRTKAGACVKQPHLWK